MKVLLVNKFLYPKGGAETYVFKLGEALKDNGHEVEYFGLENEKNIVGNSANAYAPDMDLTAGISENLLAPFKIIYSRQARRQIKKVLESFKPDVVHLNNIQFYLTPSIILEIEKYRKKEVRRNKRKNLTVNENSVADIVSDWTKIPVKRLTEGETKRLAALEKELHKRVIGQEEAVKAVAQAVKRARHLALLPFVTDMMK